MVIRFSLDRAHLLSLKVLTLIHCIVEDLTGEVSRVSGGGHIGIEFLGVVVLNGSDFEVIYCDVKSSMTSASLKELLRWKTFCN